MTWPGEARSWQRLAEVGRGGKDSSPSSKHAHLAPSCLASGFEKKQHSFLSTGTRVMARPLLSSREAPGSYPNMVQSHRALSRYAQHLPALRTWRPLPPGLSSSQP